MQQILIIVAFGRFLPHSGGQTMALFSIAIAAAEVAVGLSLIISSIPNVSKCRYCRL